MKNLVCSLLFLSIPMACGYKTDSFVSETSVRTAFTESWNVSAPEMASPGTKISVSISTEFSKSQDVLVDLLDSGSWYAGGRVTVKPGDQWNLVSFDLPKKIKDPATAYLAVKVLPVGASWEKYLDEKILTLLWPYPTPIKKPLYFGGSLNAWSYPFKSPVGNHGSSTVEVALAAATDPYLVGPFQGFYAIQSFADTYGIFKTNYGLNLETGEIYETQMDVSHEPIASETKVYAYPKTRDELPPYQSTLNNLIQAVHYNSTFQQGTEWPQLQEAYAYLQKVSARLYAQYGEMLQVNNSSSEKMRLSTSGPNLIPITYGTSSPRDILIDLLIDDQWVTGTRISVAEGSGFAAPEFKIPSSIRPMTQGILSLKIVPSGQPWTKRTAEINIPVMILGADRIQWITTQELDIVNPGSEVVVTGAFFGKQPMDVRVDLINSAGQRIAGGQATGTLSYPGEPASYSFTLSFQAPENLRRGERMILMTRLVPAGGDGTQAVDENVLAMTVE